MTPKRYTLVALISAAALASCAGNDNADYTDKSIIPTASEKAAAQKAVPGKPAPGQITLPANTIPGTSMPVNLNQQQQSININPQNNQAISAPQMVTQTAAQTTTAPGMNPPHGQPNHRCDIAVGAPLNSKPVPATAKPATASAQPLVTMKEIPNTQKTAPGMNPPHGQPGHRCDIAVGAPLNSKPAPAQATTVNAQAEQPAVTMKEVPNTQKTAPGMNPPHGQPGHRCDIAVGAPLNSKPAPAATATPVAPPPALLTPSKPDSSKN